MDKIILLNGSHSELGMLEELKKLGKYIIITGNQSNAIANPYADQYIQADYSNQEEILRIARQNNVNGIVSCSNDFGIITASYVAEKMGFPGYDSYETTRMLHQKDLFKEFAMRNHMQVPTSCQFDSMGEAIDHKDELKYPVIVKPVDLTGGKGVSRADTPGQYAQAVQRAFERSRKKVIVVEQFIDGSYHSFSTFLVNKRVVAYFSDNEYSNVYRYFVDTSAGPADDIDRNKNLLIRQAEIAAEKLNLVNGVFHMQYVMDQKKDPYVIDITRRCSGDLYSEPVEHATGIPWSKWIVMSELGFPDAAFQERGLQQKICGRHCIMAETDGIIENVMIDDRIMQYVYKDIQWWKRGYPIKNHQVDKAGILFYEFPDRETMKSIVTEVKQLVKVNLQNP